MTSTMNNLYTTLAMNVFDTINSMSPNQSEITDATCKGQVWQANPNVLNEHHGLILPVQNVLITSLGENGKFSLQPVITLTTEHNIQSVTVEIVPCKISTGVNFDINGKKYSETGTYSGTISDKVTAKIDLDTPTNEIVLTQDFIVNNQFAIVGLTFEW